MEPDMTIHPPEKQAEPQQKPQQTLGQRRVRASFNPSQNSLVDSLKAKAAELIDDIDKISQASTEGEVKRCCAKAMTEIEDAAMWAVKAATA